MLEIPGAVVISNQLNKTIKGKTISKAIAAYSKHKFAWYTGNPKNYPKLLVNKKIGKSAPVGGLIKISVEDATLLFGDGVNIRFYENRSDIPKKHHLLLEFADNTFLCCSVRMYGGMWCFISKKDAPKYVWEGVKKPNPLTEKFSKVYFKKLISDDEVQTLSVKAFLATKQRIPGLGNGVLQDILYNARIHPKQKISFLTAQQINDLFDSIKNTLKEMVDKGGRDTELDLFGKNGEYQTKVSRNTLGEHCSICNSKIVKTQYLGGSVYYCEGCQTLSQPLNTAKS